MRRLAAALALLFASSLALAQYPSKPIRFIVGFPPGGSADPVTRIIGAALKRPDVAEQLQRQGYAVEGSTPERLAAINRDDLAAWRRLVREAGIGLE